MSISDSMRTSLSTVGGFGTPPTEAVVGAVYPITRDLGLIVQSDLTIHYWIPNQGQVRTQQSAERSLHAFP